MIGRGCAGLVVVADEIDFVRAAIGRAPAPVIDDVVEDVQASGVIAVGIESACHAPVPTFVMREQIVMQTRHIAPHAGCVAVLRASGISLVTGDVERFRNERALERDVLGSARAEFFI